MSRMRFELMYFTITKFLVTFYRLFLSVPRKSNFITPENTEDLKNVFALNLEVL
jgi:hypothetical protein